MKEGVEGMINKWMKEKMEGRADGRGSKWRREKMEEGKMEDHMVGGGAMGGGGVTPNMLLVSSPGIPCS
jgi:hypothetical protein